MKITLKGLRAIHDLSQSEAAELVGVAVDTWRNWEDAKTFPNVPKIEKIQDVFNVTYNDINFLPSITVKPLKKEKEEV